MAHAAGPAADRMTRGTIPPQMLSRVVVIAAIAASSVAGTGARSGTQQAAGNPGPVVRYVANSGMLVAVGGRRFLIDAPIRDGIPPYATSASAER